MRWRIMLPLFYGVVGLILPACETSSTTATPDLVATEVAVQKAALATLTAEALPLETLTSTSTPAGQTTSDSLPTSTPTATWLAVEAQASPTNSPSPSPEVIPPSPTSTPLPPPPATNTPSPSPTPTPALFAVIEVDGDAGNQNLHGSQPVNDGRYLIFPGYAPGSIDPEDPTFRDKLVFRVEVFDAAHGGTRDGDGIQHVRFKITRDGEPDNLVYEKVENNPGYCVFGGGEPDCNIWVFAEHDYRWPGGQPVENTAYRAYVEIKPHNGEPATWNWGFRIEGMPETPPEAENLVAHIVQTGPNSDADVVGEALVFQVFASTDGVNDGAGIDRVELRIIKNGQEVYQRTEQNAAYCAFGGGEPDCNVWVFAQHGHAWPNGDPVEPGNYTLRATVHAKDGSSTVVEKTIQIQ